MQENSATQQLLAFLPNNVFANCVSKKFCDATNTLAMSQDL